MSLTNNTKKLLHDEIQTSNDSKKNVIETMKYELDKMKKQITSLELSLKECRKQQQNTNELLTHTRYQSIAMENEVALVQAREHNYKVTIDRQEREIDRLRAINSLNLKELGKARCERQSFSMETARLRRELNEIHNGRYN